MRLLFLGNISLNNEAVKKLIENQEEWQIDYYPLSEFSKDGQEYATDSENISFLDINSLSDDPQEDLDFIQKWNMADRTVVLYDAHRPEIRELFKDSGIDGCLSINSDGHFDNGSKIDAGKIENQLTERENQILSLICQEFTNREIAEQLSISVRTVDTHRRNILQKTDAKNTVGLVKYAIRHNITRL